MKENDVDGLIVGNIKSEKNIEVENQAEVDNSESDSPFIGFFSEPVEVTEIKKEDKVKNNNKESNLKSDSPYIDKFL
jgi:hypothetical protein